MTNILKTVHQITCSRVCESRGGVFTIYWAKAAVMPSMFRDSSARGLDDFSMQIINHVFSRKIVTLVLPEEGYFLCNQKTYLYNFYLHKPAICNDLEARACSKI